MKKIKQVLSNLLDDSHIHKSYFIVSIVLGFMLAGLMPIFSTPDEQYHYLASTEIVGLTNDISLYGEQEYSGMTPQTPYYQSGTSFENYFMNKAKPMAMADTPRPIYPWKDVKLSKFGSDSFNLFGHIVPAIGVYIGNLIYPSLGMMVFVSQIFSVLVYSLLVAIIIKVAKAYKLLFATLALSPVMLNNFASQSYDALGFILSFALFATVINIIVDKQITKKDYLLFAGFVVSFILGTKANIWVALLIIPLVIGMYTPAIHDRVLGAWQWLTSKVYYWLPSLLVILAGGLFVFRKLAANYGGMRVVFSKYVNTLFGDDLSPTNNINSWFSMPYATQNSLPDWTTALWLVVVAVVILSSKVVIDSVPFSVMSLAIIVISWLGTLYIFLRSDDATKQYIGGQQGRYFVSLVPTVAFFINNQKFKLQMVYTKAIPVLVFGVAALTNIMLVVDTISGLKGL
jgi:uncharacterized membrane protein